LILYRQVKEYLLREIEKNKEGSILPSQSFLMKKFHVCHLTVRKALKDLEKEGLIVRKQGKGTFIRKKISTRCPKRILVVVPSDWKSDCWNAGPFMEKLTDEALERQIHIYISPLGKSYYEILKLVESQKFNGVIWLMPWEKDLPVMREIFEKGCHVMVINRIFSDHRFSYISTDHEMGAYEATMYLINKGHRRIGFAGYIKVSHILQRYAGFRRALDDSGIDPSKSEVVTAFLDKARKNQIEDYREDFIRMLAEYRPTAIFVSGVSVLLNMVLPVLREKKLRIPDDLEIFTYDEMNNDIPEKSIIHELAQPFYEMGRISIEKMECIIKRHCGAMKVILRPELLIKQDNENVLIPVNRGEMTKGGEKNEKERIYSH